MNNSIYNRLLQKEAKLAVIGLGYVGLPIALEFARKNGLDPDSPTGLNKVTLTN